MTWMLAPWLRCFPTTTGPLPWWDRRRGSGRSRSACRRYRHGRGRPSSPPAAPIPASAPGRPARRCPHAGTHTRWTCRSRCRRPVTLSGYRRETSAAPAPPAPACSTPAARHECRAGPAQSNRQVTNTTVRSRTDRVAVYVTLVKRRAPMKLISGRTNIHTTALRLFLTPQHNQHVTKVNYTPSPTATRKGSLGALIPAGRLRGGVCDGFQVGA
jgi:hypothetical protein